MKILCIGDSNTYGYDPRSYLGSRYPSDVRWTDRLGNHEVLNSGINGLSIPWDASEYLRMVQSKSPNLVIVMLGSNDLLEGAGAAVAAARMEHFLQVIQGIGVKILLISPPPMQLGQWVQDVELIEESQKLAVAYRKLADRMGIRFADAGEWGVELTFDGVHFSPNGHAAFAKELRDRLQKMKNE